MNSLVQKVPFGPKALKTCVTLWKCLAHSILPLLLAFYQYGASFYGYLLFSLVVLSVLGIIYFSQDILVYHNDNPANSRLYVQSLIQESKAPPGGFESVHIVTEDLVVLHGYLLKVDKSEISTRPTIIYFHGNAGNIGHRLPNAVEMVLELKCNVLLVEYRGYGKSTGSASEEGLYADAKAAIDFAKNHCNLNPDKIIIFGRSLGGAVAIDAAVGLTNYQEDNSSRESFGTTFVGAQLSGKPSPSGSATPFFMLIVENTFTHIADIAEIMFQVPGFNYIPKLFYKNKYASIDKIGSVGIPALFISGQADQLVPPHMMATLFTKCSSYKKRLLKVRGGTHNETWMTSGYYDSIKKFIDEVFPNDDSVSGLTSHSPVSSEYQQPPQQSAQSRINPILNPISRNITPLEYVHAVSFRSNDFNSNQNFDNDGTV